jgi:hypothetical protein
MHLTKNLSLKPIGVPESRHEGRLGGKGILEKKTTYSMDGHSFTQAHYTVLHNSTLVAPYIEEHKHIVRSQNPGKPKSQIKLVDEATFSCCLRIRLIIDDITVEKELYLLAKSPSSTISTFQGYEINGNTFYMIGPR